MWPNEYETLEDTHTAIGRYADRYHDRPHSRLAYRTRCIVVAGGPKCKQVSGLK